MRAQSVPPGKNETKRDFILPTWRQKRFEVRKCCVCEKAFPDPDVFGLWESFSNFVKFGGFALNSNYVLHNSIEIRFSR
jgi:hypothetical protein